MGLRTERVDDSLDLPTVLVFWTISPRYNGAVGSLRGRTADQKFAEIVEKCRAAHWVDASTGVRCRSPQASLRCENVFNSVRFK